MPSAPAVDPSPFPSAHTVDILLVDSRIVVREGLRALIEQQSDLVVVAQATSVHDARGLNVTPDVIVTDIELPDATLGDVIIGLRELFRETSILVLTRVDHPAKVQSVLAAGASGYLLKTAATTELLKGIRLVATGKRYLQPSLGVELARWHRPRHTTLGRSPEEEQTFRSDSARTFSNREEEEPAIDTSAPVPARDRVIELEHRLRRIAAELEAAGVNDSFSRLPNPDRLPGLEDVTSRQREVATRLARGERVSAIARGMYLSPSTVRNHLTSLYRKVGVHSQSEFLDLLRRHDSKRP
jgi:DNA-binding NarL/FixJ family response regulator